MRASPGLKRLQARPPSDMQPMFSAQGRTSLEDPSSDHEDDGDMLRPFAGVLLSALIGSMFWLSGAVLLAALLRD